MAFDTLKFAKRLAQVDALQANLATKADLKDAITDLKAELKADISGLRTELKTDIAKLQTDTAWIKWIITGGVGLYVLRSIVEWLR